MGALPTELRNQLAKACVAAREAAEAGARSALQSLAVHHHEPHGSMTPQQRALRNRLRAHGRQLGDARDAKRGTQTIDRLVHECAYEHWHRMLFARFLAENHLLIEPNSGAAITMEECQDLARESGQDPWALASRFAQRMLPQIFRPDDPVLEVALPPETRQSLERLLAELPAAVFIADDALGWTYQFWQSAAKDRVNASGEKITGATLPAVTQLFTEHYMVLFLLHNTIGAWHAGKVLQSRDRQGADNDSATEADARRAVALPDYEFEYLRFVRGVDGQAGPWRPAAGTFDGWPRAAKDLKVLDPCCGSGHFLVEVFELLVRLRMAEEGLTLQDAIRAVLADNLFGLEIDQRCCQIAAFNLALAAWKWAGRVLALPPLNIACSGIGPQATAEEWLRLAEQSGIPMPSVGREPIRNGLLNLHRLFSQAPTLGSLINPAELPADLIAADYQTIQPYLAAVFKAERVDDETRERAIAAAGMSKAADVLAGEYTLVTTNVPYLATRKQSSVLQSHCTHSFPEAKNDLAVSFLLRLSRLVCKKASLALVLSQYWLFKSSYEEARRQTLVTWEWNLLGRLGPGAFETVSGEVVNVCVGVWTCDEPHENHEIASIDLVKVASASAKALSLACENIVLIKQATQLENPNARIITGDRDAFPTLEAVTLVPQGVKTGDDDRWRRFRWEIPGDSSGWVNYQTTVRDHVLFGGRNLVLDWRTAGRGMVRPRVENKAVGLLGIAVSQSGDLPATIYTGERFDSNVAPIIPKDQTLLPALWEFFTSEEYLESVRQIDQSLKVTNGPLVQVPFDEDRWRRETAETGALPEPESGDPTQWLFHGRPEESTAPFQVAVARLLGYRWPAELDDKMRLSERARALVQRCEELAGFADEDGIVCIPALRGERSAADRLLALLTACGIKPDRDLDAWLRDDFFAGHCALFHHRPFVWHIWDGRRDGFHALVNYHRLAGPEGEGRRTLESLTFSYLGDWIERQKAEQREGREGADARLAAAQDLQEQLKKILEGEPPYDIFVRWKPLHQQPIGWEPDINDGVRLNTRPFMMATLRKGGKKGAGILRAKPNINWKKDRGKEPQSLRPTTDFPWFWSCDPEKHADHRLDFMGGAKFDGNRWNDLHYSNDARRAARVCRPREAAS